jgi:hypothetical protein
MFRSAAGWLPLFIWFSVGAQVPKGVIQGQVINSVTSAPISGLRLLFFKGQNWEELKRPLDGSPVVVHTDESGRFVGVVPEPDIYILKIDRPGVMPTSRMGPLVFVDLRLTPTQPESDFNLPGITVQKSRDRDGTFRVTVGIKLSYYPTIDGKVTNPDGLAMENCLMQLYREEPKERSGQKSTSVQPISSTSEDEISLPFGGGSPVITNARGEYHIGKLGPGTYYVKEMCGPWSPKPNLWQPGYRETFYPAATDIASAKVIRVALGQHARADIRISAAPGVTVTPGIKITGRLLNFTGETRVWMAKTESSDARSALPHQATVVKDHYTVENLLPGRYVVRATNRARTMGAVRDIEVRDRDLEIDLTLLPTTQNEDNSVR